MKKIRFAIIGLGLMGREFASAIARWCHLTDIDTKIDIVAICSRTKKPDIIKWYTANFSTITQITDNYLDIVRNPDIDAVYCAVPHHLHKEIYCEIIKSGKHLLGEKPFGINKEDNNRILECIKKHPDVFVRCSSEFPFYPAVQRICDMIEQKKFGKIIEVNCGLLHSSDLDTEKPINWKRIIEYNGEYGCMGDLGMHVCHVPFRAGWIPKNVRAILSKIISERPDCNGNRVPCLTWDNAILFCETVDKLSGDNFPMILKTERIAPGEKNTWYIEIIGTISSARFSTKNPRLLQVLCYQQGKEQKWENIDIRYEPTFKTISGSIFEFGFTDVFLQMIAGFVYELCYGKPLKKFAGCVTPDETALSHSLFTSAIESYKKHTVIDIT